MPCRFLIWLFLIGTILCFIKFFEGVLNGNKKIKDIQQTLQDAIMLIERAIEIYDESAKNNISQEQLVANLERLTKPENIRVKQNDSTSKPDAVD